MLTSIIRRRDTTRRRRVAVGALAAVLALAIFGFPLATSQHDSSGIPATTTGSAARSVGASAQPENKSPAPQDASSLRPLAPTSDPEAFAREVAEALFDWDTNTPITPDDVARRLTAVGDPTGTSTTGLIADVTSYLPTADAWSQLRRYGTTQRIEIVSMSVPSLWSTALRQAGTQLAAGTTAYTIRGVRHRTGVWERRNVTTTHHVAFTVFMTCGPVYPECHLLRLSALDNPLS